MFRRECSLIVFGILVATHLLQAQQAPETSKKAAQSGAKIVVDLTNKFRQEQKLSPVKNNAKLAATAQKFANFMARTDQYGHEADGRKPADRAKAEGYEYCIVLENIGWRYRSKDIDYDLAGEWLTQAWKESPTHRDHMLDADVTETGVGIAKSEKTGRYYGVQLFGRPSSAKIACKIINHAEREITYKIITSQGTKSYQLKPRFNRSHAVCRAAQIGLPGVRQPRNLNTGEEFLVTESEGKLTITISRNQ